MPPDKNTSPSVNVAAVGGGKDHSSVAVVTDGVDPPKDIAEVYVPAPPC